MEPHLFLFAPGRWVGAGRITFSISKELIRFYTRWTIEKDQQGRFNCDQIVEMQGIQEKVENRFIVSSLIENKFKIEMQSEAVGSAIGSGIVDVKTIAWEFHGQAGIEGFEVYELQENGDYMLHAEYASSDSFRTIIDARIWRKDEGFA